MFEYKVMGYITKEVDKRVDKIISEVDKRAIGREERFINVISDIVADERAEAYSQGYKDATEDVCRRLMNLYTVAYRTGKANGMADAGAIDLEETEDDIAEALGEETA